MNSLILVLNTVFALMAAILSILSWFTFKALRHLKISRSFWILTLVSGAVFFVGSVFAIFQEINFQLTPVTNEVVQISQLLALCILVGSIYSYSRKVKGSLPKKLQIQKRKNRKKLKKEAQEGLIVEIPVREKKVSEIQKVEVASVCKRQFGYLRMLPYDATVPSECLNCPRLIECRHSLPEVAQAQQEKSSNEK
ncbi:MAG: hypothetical protein PVF15_07815 [Candidatus Bathyarchaeota archaeon]|jgi:hypothetical protein